MDFSHLFVAIVSALLGGAVAWFVGLHWERRIPSADRVFRRMWRRVRRMKIRFQELEHVQSVLDLQGDRLAPLAYEIHREELTLEQSTEALDRLKARLHVSEGNPPGALPGYTHGIRRTMTSREPYAVLTRRTEFPGVYQPGEHATPEAESPERATQVRHEEMVADQVLMAHVRAEAERRVHDESLEDG